MHPARGGCGFDSHLSNDFPLRDIAQLGSASASGAEGPEFKSPYPDRKPWPPESRSGLAATSRENAINWRILG